MKRDGMLALALALGLTLSAGAAEIKQSAIDGWTLAIQGWTFNSKTVFEVIDIAKDLGVGYIEEFPGQKISKEIKDGFGPGMSKAATDALKAKLDEAGVKIVAFGVTGIPGDEKGARKMFEWGKSWGITVFNTEADKKAFPMFDKLTEEFGIKVGLHNHPKPSRYWDPAFLLKETEGSKVGACADCGHWYRSGLVSLDCVKQLKGHINSLHFKDLGKNKSDMPWGTGVCDAKAMLAELKAQGFKGNFSIEYEKWDAQQMANVKACVDWWHQTVKELADAK